MPDPVADTEIDTSLPAADEVEPVVDHALPEATGTELPPADTPTGYDWTADESKLAEFELPEGLTLGGREVKGSIKELFESQEGRLAGLRKVISEKGYAAPEKYEVPDDSMWAQPDNKDMVEPLYEVFKGLDMSQSQVDGTLDLLAEVSNAMAETAKKAQQVDLMDTWGLTGEAYKARFDEVAAWAKENTDPIVYEGLRKMGANGVEVAYDMMMSKREGALYKGPDSSTETTGLLAPEELATIQSSEAYTDPNHKDHKAVKAKVREHMKIVTEQKKLKPPRANK
jgi:hypothetical protein